MTENQRIRLRYAKRGRLRFISHHDLLQTFERAIRRAGFSVAYTQGFNPRPKLTFALALPLGVESHDEVVDIDLEDHSDAGTFFESMKRVLPPGLDPIDCECVDGRAKLQVAACEYYVDLPESMRATAQDGLERYAASEAPLVTRERKGKVREIQLKQLLDGVRLDRQRLSFSVLYPAEGSVKPAEFLTWLGLPESEIKTVKTKTVLKNSPPPSSSGTPNAPEVV